MLNMHRIIFSLLCIFTISYATEPVKQTDGQGDSSTLKPFYSSANSELNDEARSNRLQELLQLDDQKSSAPESRKQDSYANKNAVSKAPIQQLIKPAEWMLESSISNASSLLKGILFYLQLNAHDSRERPSLTRVGSFHRFILVGPPGTGKTTLAYAIANALNCTTLFVQATSFLGQYRNQAATNIRNFFRQEAADGIKKVIIIDELHKLFEHHKNDHSDDSQTAAAFWLALDSIEKYSPQIIIIGTANSVDKLPPEIKSRFFGRIVSVPLPDKNRRIQMFKNSIENDQSIILEDSIDDAFIAGIMQQIGTGSLRDVQLVIDTAKMFNYAHDAEVFPILPLILTKTNFRHAINQLQTEFKTLQEGYFDMLYNKVQRWSAVLSFVVNIGILANTSADLIRKVPSILTNL